MTTIYFIRHSKSLKTNNIINTDNLQIQNEKQSLSIEGEELAKEKLNVSELKNIDFLISSNYVRAISTAKYIAKYNDIEINIAETFGERKFGVNSWKEIPDDFYERQFQDPNFKIGSGENQIEVRSRMLWSLNEVLKQMNNKRVAIVTHSTALSFLLMNWCKLDETGIYFKDKRVAPLQIENCDIFKLIFDDNKELTELTKI